VHLRRALLLFAIVLGLAAVAASVSRTERGRPEPTPPPPERGPEMARPGRVKPAPDPGTRTVRFSQGGRRKVRRLTTGRAATVLVDVKSAGQAELEGLSDTETADPATPASFDVYRTRPGRFPVVFHPAAGDRAQTLGTLKVVRR
jgi:hypothetical protein